MIKKILILTGLSLKFLIAGACSGGVCGASIKPFIPTDIQNGNKFKTFGVLKKEEKYKGWIVVDNAGDENVGDNRFMAGIDINSIFSDKDKISLFGLISSENIYGENLKSGKIAYTYPISWQNLVFEGAYLQTNYSLNQVDGIGTNRIFKGNIKYPFIDTTNKKLNFSLDFSRNAIDEELDFQSFTIDNGKETNSITANIEYEIKNYNLFNFDSSHKIHFGLKIGDLSFNDIRNSKIDKILYDTQGSYSKINLEYRGSVSILEELSIDSNIRGQLALNNKNLDNSEAFSVGGINGVKLFSESLSYDSNGFLFSIEPKYSLPEFKSINNKIGVFYDYAQLWTSDSLGFGDNSDIAIQDAGVGIYTNYKKVFSKLQFAYQVGESDLDTVNNEDYRVIFQLGALF